MDVESLRNELEGHLKNNPDEHAPHGFRDRFDATVEDIEAADGDENRTKLEAQLHQIRVEAEMAVKCACGDGDEPPAPTAGRVEGAEAPAAEPKAEDSGSAAAVAPVAADPEIAEAKIYDVPEDPGQGLIQRYGILLVVALVVVVAAVYYMRG